MSSESKPDLLNFDPVLDRLVDRSSQAFELVAEAMEQRAAFTEAVLKAFMDAHGIGPESVEIVQEIGPSGVSIRFRKVGTP